MDSGEDIIFVDAHVSENSRIRRSHYKSKDGCASCKRRKVKCDELLPKCSACRKRNQVCIRGELPEDREDDGMPSEERIPGSSQQTDLSATKMFYRFQHSTADSLGLGGRLWRESVPLALEEDYLMHAMISIAAAHARADDERANHSYKQTELQHQVAAIRGLRDAMNGVGTAKPRTDAVIGSALLLYHHIWTTLDENGSSRDGIAGSPSWLPMVAQPFNPVILASVSLGPSMWHETLFYSPKTTLQTVASHLTLADELEAFFRAQLQQLCAEGVADDGRYTTFVAECCRLIPVLAVLILRDRDSLNVEHVSGSIIRYIFSWPMLCSEQFLEMERRRDLLAYVVLFHFYTTAAKSGIDSMWWARRRTDFALKQAHVEFEKAGVEVSNVFEAFDAQVV